ncbi:VOC family protein [Saccharothrix sp. ST-888]|uniref:VOC family protein n=1 Tax=Saccharothrix sp. ST-888 TaxID=1427391 RepID=UPI0005EC6262|nr:VOC family protein [Saccharothrix sp. ST-888]
MPARFKDLCLDANDHQALADWWCTAMGYVRRPGSHEPGWPVPIEDPTGAGPLIWVNPVAGPKTVKNRVHLDVFGDTAELLALGATLVRERGGDIEWDILSDPNTPDYQFWSDPRCRPPPLPVTSGIRPPLRRT